MSAKPKPISEQLKNAIRNAGVSRYRIAQETGLTQATLSRFMNGVAGLSLDSIDKIGDFLGLGITTGKQKPKPRKGK